MNTVIVLRGRNTQAILENFFEGTIGNHIVVCRKDDELRREGDVEVDDFICPEGNITLIANGGTTAQLVPVLIKIVKSTDRYQVLDVQRDTTVYLDGPLKGMVTIRG